MSSKAIIVDNVSKYFEVYASPNDRLKDMVFPRLQKMLGRPEGEYHKKFWALKNVSFEIEKGQTVGILGQNGSGKSTLLQIIMGTMNASTGSVTTQGKVSGLLELGSGFNPDFTGRENVYLNGSLLGLSKSEIDNKFDDIAAFADIGEHLDMAVKTYSSGMMLRLAFAVQVFVDSDILIIDEALAVGDARFQLKCFRRFHEIKEKGVTIIFVSHDIESVRSLCEQGLLLNHGQTVYFGDAKEASTRYYSLLFPESDTQQADLKKDDKKSEEPIVSQDTKDIVLKKTDSENPVSFGSSSLKKSWGAGGAAITKFDIVGLQSPNVVERGQTVRFNCTIEIDQGFISRLLEEEKLENNLFASIRLDTHKGIALFDMYGVLDQSKFKKVDEKTSTTECTFHLEIPELVGGEYYITPAVALGTLEKVAPLWSSDYVTSLRLPFSKTIRGLMKTNYTLTQNVIGD